MNRHALFTSMFLLAACGTITEGLGDAEETGETDGNTAGDGDGDGDTETSDDSDATSDGDGDGDGDSDGETTDEETDDEMTDGGDPAWPEPYALWEFDGNLLDSVGVAHGADPSDQVEYDILDSCEGVRFVDAPDGDAGHIVVSNLAQDILDWEESSIAIRLYANPGAIKQCYMSLGLKDEPNENPNENGFGVWLAEAGGVHIYSEAENADDQWLFVGSRPEENAWHTLVWTFSDGFVRYYADGTLVSEMPYDMSVTSTTFMAIGGWYGYHPLAGLLDQAAVFDRQLTDDEILAMSSESER